MGFVKINDDFRVDYEPRCLTLQRKGAKKDKTTGAIEDAWYNEGYYSSWPCIMDILVKIFTSEKVHKKQIADLQEFKNLYLESVEEVKNLMNFTDKKYL